MCKFKHIIQKASEPMQPTDDRTTWSKSPWMVLSTYKERRKTIGPISHSCVNLRQTTGAIVAGLPGHDEVRSRFLQQVHSVWDRARLSDMWHDIDWLNYDVPKWKRLWGFQGYCPNLSLGASAQTCAQETSKLAIKAAWDMWENRNKKALEWGTW